MKTQNLFLAGLILILGNGCGKAPDNSSSSQAATVQSKDLFSSWADSSGTVLDLSTVTFGTGSLNYYIGNAKCVVTFLIGGTETDGNLDLNNAYYASGGSGDPGCASLDGSYTYTKTATALTVCNPQTSKCDSLQ